MVTRGSMLRTDRDGRDSLAGSLTPRDSHHADWMLGCAIVLLMVFACWRAGQLEGSGTVRVEETDGPASEVMP